MRVTPSTNLEPSPGRKNWLFKLLADTGGVILTLVLLAACATSTNYHDLTTARPISPSAVLASSEAQIVFLSLVAPVNASHDAMVRALDGSDEESPAALSATIDRAYRALQKFDTALLTTPWPSAVEVKVDTLARANHIVLADYIKLKASVATLSTIPPTLAGDTALADRAATQVRAALRLQPAPSHTW